MADFEELEPLFDYKRGQPCIPISIDDENHSNMVSNKHKKKSREIEIPDIEVVQSAIEKCIRYRMKWKEIINFLGFKIDPALIRIVWDVMKSENVEFFKGYYTNHYVCDQLAEYKRLLQLKNEFDMASNSSAANNYIHNNSYQKPWHNSSDSANGTTGNYIPNDICLTQNRNFNNNPLLYYKAMQSYGGHGPEYNIPNTSQYYTQSPVPDGTMNCHAMGHSNGMLSMEQLVNVRGFSPYGSQHQSAVTGIESVRSMETDTELNFVVPVNREVNHMNHNYPIETPVLEPNSTPNVEVDFQPSHTNVAMEEPNLSPNMEDEFLLSDTYGFDEENSIINIFYEKSPRKMENFDFSLID